MIVNQTNWIKFDPKLMAVYGLAKKQDLGYYKITISCTDSYNLIS